ncbi:MAG: YidC/Oxa1 family membrane protein insertase [Clostridia bacterium]|nr:YidC/Oxa1 family membrane protein insertase [Clostridia bacterium]
MNSVFDIINVPLGYLFRGIYTFVGSYGWTIILFTIIIKLILVPLNIKQQKSMKKTQAIQPRLMKLQEKYGQDKEKLSQETMKLYQEAGVNPMGGCLPMLIQFPIIIALYNIIRKPMSYVMMLSKEVIGIINERLGGVEPIDQIGLAKSMGGSMDKLSDVVSESALINFDFFGFDLSVTPTFNFIMQNWQYALIPILAGLTTYLVSVVSTKISGTGANPDAAGSMKTMNTIFPFMTAWFAITLPAGLGLYWTISNLFQIGQMFVLNKVLKVEVPTILSEDEKHFRERKKKKK